MVVLCVRDTNQMSLLEAALNRCEIKYQVSVDDKDSYNLGLPYLMVDGVPLDMIRAFEWMEEYYKHE